MLIKHRSDTSQDALKMFQNISNGPVKQSFLMYDMLKAKIDRLALKIISKNKKPFKTRLTYNCAHLRSTKESLTFKYFDTGRYWLVLGQYRTVRVDI